MKVLSLGGAGAVCRHATRDLAEFSDFDEIVIGDYDVAAAEKLAAEIGACACKGSTPETMTGWSGPLRDST